MPQTAPFVFLSHSGADTEAALTLKRRLESAPDAQKAGLKVWFDKDDLRPGKSWSAQIARAIQQEANTFIVYVGSGGIMNWVDAEVDLAISRATTDKQNPLLFIPALAADSAGSKALPPFVKRYQGVRDPLGDGDEFAKLLKAVLGLDWGVSPKIVDEPFVGLRSMREEESDCFFGRDAEIKDLVGKFHKHRIVAIVADSGTGKSSLAQAGFIPAFRGGKLVDPIREDAHEKIWQVVTMRPGADPAAGLRQAVSEAAEKLGRSLNERSSLRKQVLIDDASETGYALQCGLPIAKTSTLLVVDQFEELFTTTPEKDAAAFAALLLALADGPSDVRVLITVRADYFNLASGLRVASGDPALFARLTAENNDAILRLKAMSADSVREVVCRPLKLAGEGDAVANRALLEAVQSDISNQASDLPLLQVALRAAWQERKATGRPILECYQSVGRVSGALAREADKARDQLPGGEGELLESIFVRLVRLGDTGGATRRLALLHEFDPLRRALLQKLGGDEYGRLVAVGERGAELSHEALITQWPWLHKTLTTNAADVRRLERLMERTKEWREALEDKRGSYLATGAERELFRDLAEHRTSWLSQTERDFVNVSQKTFQDDVAARKAEAEQRQRERDAEHARKLADARTIAWRTLIGGAVAVVLAIAAALFGWYAQSESGIAYEKSVEANARTAEAIKAKQEADAAALTAERQKVLADEKAEEAVREKQNADAAKRDALSQKTLADAAASKAIRNQSVALTALANVEAEKNPVRAVKLALAAWPRGHDDLASMPRLGETLDVLGHVVPDLLVSNVWVLEDVGQFATFNPKGTLVVTADRHGDESARVWDAVSGRSISRLVGHAGEVYRAAFNSDGTRIVTASEDDTARVWDALSGRAVAILKGHTEPVWFAAFSQDGTRIATASDDKTARIWDATSGGMVATLTGHEGGVRRAEFSPNGKRVVTASSDHTARLWDSASGHEIAKMRHGGEVNSAVFSPDGSRIVTSSSDKTARVWDALSGRAIATLAGHEDGVFSAAFSPDGSRVVTASFDKTARVWDTATGRLIATLTGHTSGVYTALFSSDGRRIVTAGYDNTGRVWDAASGRLLVILVGHTDIVWQAEFSPDGLRVLTSAQNGSVRMWDVSTGRVVATLAGHGGDVNSAVFSPDGSRIVTASDDMTARLWNAASGKPVAALVGHDGRVNSALFSPDGSRIITASADKTARVWDGASGKPIARLTGHDGPVNSAVFSPDGSRIVTASDDKTARVWDATSGKLIATLTGHDGPVNLAAFSPDGSRLITASKDRSLDITARVWDAGSWRMVAVLLEPMEVGLPTLLSATPIFAAFSPDGKRVVTASGYAAHLWDQATARSLATMPSNEGVDRPKFSPDGSRILTITYGNSASIWDASTGRPIAKLAGHDGDVNSAVFSPDGTRIITASKDKTARVWDALAGRAIATLAGHDDVVSSAAFSPDGMHVVTASKDKTARVWDVSTIPRGNIVEVACRLLNGNTALKGVTDYPLTFDRPICVNDPPPPDLTGDSAPERRSSE